jgi:hypothetical protein
VRLYRFKKMGYHPWEVYKKYVWILGEILLCLGALFVAEV